MRKQVELALTRPLVKCADSEMKASKVSGSSLPLVLILLAAVAVGVAKNAQAIKQRHIARQLDQVLNDTLAIAKGAKLYYLTTCTIGEVDLQTLEDGFLDPISKNLATYKLNLSKSASGFSVEIFLTPIDPSYLPKISAKTFTGMLKEVTGDGLKLTKTFGMSFSENRVAWEARLFTGASSTCDI